MDIPVPPGSGEVTTDLEINAVRFDSEQDLDLVKTVTGSYTTSSEAMTYDLDGNLLTWDGWTFAWNGENRLIKAEKGLLRVEADYDYLGRRFEKKVYHGETLTSHQRFLYDDYKLIEIRDALNENALETSYLWQPLQLDVPVAMKSGADWAYYLFDGNKNITSLRAEDGTVLAEYHYGPFGQTLSATGPWAAVNPFRFSSEYHDAETGLVYYNYRHYSPELGRWLNRDPIEEQGGINLYGMAGNDVINVLDSLGFVPFTWKGTVGTLLTGLGGPLALLPGAGVAGGVMIGVGSGLLAWDAYDLVNTQKGALAKLRKALSGMDPNDLGALRSRWLENPDDIDANWLDCYNEFLDYHYDAILATMMNDVPGYMDRYYSMKNDPSWSEAKIKEQVINDWIEYENYDPNRLSH